MTYGIVGGGDRYKSLARLVSKKNDVITLGADSDSDRNLGAVISRCDVIILPIPLKSDVILKGSLLYPDGIRLCDIKNKITDKQVFGGALSDEIAAAYPFIHDFSTPMFAYKNAVLTAEGLICEMIRQSRRSIFMSNILITGYGRIAKITAEYLKKMGAFVTIAARRQSALSEAFCSGFKIMNLSDLNLSGYDYVINTVPHMVFDKRVLNTADMTAAPEIFDIASAPGGVDFDQAKTLGIPTYFLPMLPSVYSPDTAAEYIYDEITNILEKES